MATALKSIEFPIHEGTLDDGPVYSVSGTNGRQLLSRRFNVTSEPRTAFPSLNYQRSSEMRFIRWALPIHSLGCPIGLLVDIHGEITLLSCPGPSKKPLLSRSGLSQGNPGHKVHGKRYPFKFTRNLPQILAPLLVSLQFYNEAISVFYNINHFHRLHLSHPERFLLSIPEERRKHIRHISVEYRMTSDTKYARPAFELLASVTRLRKFDIRIDEQIWLQNPGHVKPPVFDRR